VPVALVLETLTEFHDFFREVLLALFDLIRVPPERISLPQCSMNMGDNNGCPK